MKSLRILALSVALLCPSVALAGDPIELLGEGYKKASPTEKITMMACYIKDNSRKPYKERKVWEGAFRTEAENLYIAEIKKGKTAEEQLKKLGALRKSVSENFKKVNAERRKAKKQSIYSMDASSSLQRAIAVKFIKENAGATPALEKLGILSVVRENTGWTSHASLTLAVVTEAMNRHEGYRKADAPGKLEIHRKCEVEWKMISSQERQYLDKAILTGWIHNELKAGKSADDLLAAVKSLKSQGKICWFASSWATDLLNKYKAVN